MGPHFAIFWIMLASGGPRPADVSWTAGVPLWTSLSPAGKVVDAGPFAQWASPPPAARSLPEMPPPAPEPLPLPQPRELPETVDPTIGPLLPPGVPAAQLIITSPTVPPIPPKPEPISPPIAVQATQRRIHPAGDCYTPGKAFVPGVKKIDEPAARLVLPSR